MSDPDCICRGNWRGIVKEAEPLLDKRFRNHRGEEYIFFGVVHGSDDYYYGMSSVDPKAKRRLILSSCVGSLETNGYTAIPAEELNQ